MLKSGFIPRRQPNIKVGIVMPEDQIKSLTLDIPSTPAYILKSGRQKSTLAPLSQISVTLMDNFIQLKISDNVEPVEKIIISPQNYKQQLNPGQGIKIHSVLAGRGFHWQKKIDVFLPGKLIIQKYNNVLILINELYLEHYVMCVATSEMSAACPMAFMEAQTIAARSWLLAGHEHKHAALGMDVCNDDCCQRYQGTTFLSSQSIEGGMNTFGKVLIYKGKICDARYSKNCGGIAESFENVWPGEKHDYLPVQPDSSIPPGKNISTEKEFYNWLHETPRAFCSPHFLPQKNIHKYLGGVDEQGNYFRWEKRLSDQEIKDALNKYAGLKIEKLTGFKVLRRGGSGRINILNIDYKDQNQKNRSFTIESEYKIRRFLSDSFLLSSAIIIVHDEARDNYIIKGAGWGHGVGLCQMGALGMALNGYNADQIVHHYFPGSLPEKIY
jgi:SpoIID/LytB domain protein